MRFLNVFLTFIIFIFSGLSFSQTEIKKVKISGKIREKTSNQPLEYATISLINTKTSKTISGGITNNLGEFSVDVVAGIYDVKVEFISFNALIIKQQNLSENTNLGIIAMSENPSQLGEVVVRAETSTLEIKLDKKVYSVGKDMIVKGGSATDVLNNVPSVTVDGDGNVSLRGNENVKIFIDGRPSNAVSIANALQAIPADAIDKVEVISNPSARYDAEGGAGILNIVLKKGKSNGLNGSIVATVGLPKNLNLQTNLNFKSELFNFFTNIGLTNSLSPGNFLTNTNYFDSNRNIERTINETRDNERVRKGHNYNFGIDLSLDKSTNWINTLNFRTSEGSNPEEVKLRNNLATGNFVRNRDNNQFNFSKNVEFTSNFIKKFKKDGHKFTADFSASNDNDNDSSFIFDFLDGQENLKTTTQTRNFQNQYKQLLQFDYVLPLGKMSQIESGFKGDINKLETDFGTGDLDNLGNYIPNLLNTNNFNYKENINAVYLQFGSKYKKFSYLIGLRYEDSKINFNLKTENETIKNYQNWFPSAFLTYSVSENSTISINYSKRITRPRNRFINPFAGINSNINFFEGNPDINPSFTDAIDLGFLTKVKKSTFTASLYYNRAKNPFLFIRRQTGNFVNNVPVLISTPINLDIENRFGIEFTTNFSVAKWWKLNTNFNFFQSDVNGIYNYTLKSNNSQITENFERISTNWFVKINSKITLPYKIDWQLNGIYTAPQNTPQGKSIGIYNINLAFSKDILKDKATVSLNVSDLFNSTKMIRQFNLPTIESYTEMQRKVRQINLSFTYRFNKKKEEKPVRSRQEDGGGDY